jgi:hypothetical protein
MRSQSASNARLASGALAQVSQSQPPSTFTPAGLVSGARALGCWVRRTAQCPQALC